MDSPGFRIGVLAPMPSELRPVVKAMGLIARGDGAYLGRVGSVEVVAMRTGMGLARATDAVTRLLDSEAVDHVMVVGIAGGIGTARVGDIICPAVVVDGATGVSFTATPIGAVHGTISSSDEFVVDPDRIGALVDAGVRAVDMETAAIAAVCVQRGCAWSAVRVVSDHATDHPDTAVLGLAHPDGSPNVRAALMFMATHPARIPGLLRLGRDATKAASRAAAEATHRIRAIV
ncbi:MAG: hypothetical protein ABIP21_09645 [Acidimicrobiia bacterium]